MKGPPPPEVPTPAEVASRGRMAAAISSCRECLHFNNAAALLEAALPGLSSLSSAHAAVRSDDGLCDFHARYVAASSICAAAVASAQA